MKFTDKVKIKNIIPFQFGDDTLYVKNVPISQTDELFSKLNSIAKVANKKDLTEDEANAAAKEAESGMLVIFNELLVDENGDPFDEFKDASWADITEILSMNTMHELTAEVGKVLKGKQSGN